MGYFKVGDIIRGTSAKYNWTDISMTKGIVEAVYPEEACMCVKILEHKSKTIIGMTYSDVENNPNDFELLNRKDYKIEVLVNYEKRVVVALLKQDHDVLARGIAKCDPTDTFNVMLGYQLATGRLFAEMAKAGIAL